MITAQIVRPQDEPSLDAAQLRTLREAQANDGSLARAASAMGFSNEADALKAVAVSLGMDVIDVAATQVDLSLLDEFPVKLIHRYKVFPIHRDDTSNSLVVVTGDPFDVHALDAVAAAIGSSIIPVLAPQQDVAKLIKTHMGVGAETIDGLLAQRGDQQGEEGIEVLDELNWDRSEESQEAQQASVVRLVNEILCEAIELYASDIHLESQASGLRIRYRIDGVLQVQSMPPEIHQFQAAIISRLKIMAKLNIAERRVPQDGRIKLKVSGREVDIRVSIIPMLYGEGIVMRVLDKSRMTFSLTGLGMNDDAYRTFNNLIKIPHGIVLVTGPTGSGKTTTLYSALNEIKDDATKIITTEDPIEYELEGINQIQVQPQVGLTFASSLRSILRHDPEVILIGEIRDQETAENAVQASLTGHLVFSTLHTNDSAGAFPRLIDMGVEPFLVTSTVEGVLAQRLVRMLCPECRERWTPGDDELPGDFPIDPFRQLEKKIYRAVGCRSCLGTGYRGRIGLYELLVTNDEIRQLAGQRCGSTPIKQAAIRSGMRTLREDGWQTVMEGKTTIDEVIRATKSE